MQISQVMTSYTQRSQPRSQGPLSTSRKYPGYGWSRVCWILADSRDVIEGRGWKVKVVSTEFTY